MSSPSEPHAQILVLGDGNKVEPSTPTDAGSLRSIWTDGEDSEGEEETEGEDGDEGKGDVDFDVEGEVGEVGGEEGQKEAAEGEGEAIDHVGTDGEGKAPTAVGTNGNHNGPAAVDSNTVTSAQVDQQPTPEAVTITGPATNEQAGGASPATKDQADPLQERELGPSGRRYHLRSMAERKRQLWGKEDI